MNGSKDGSWIDGDKWIMDWSTMVRWIWDKMMVWKWIAELIFQPSDPQVCGWHKPSTYVHQHTIFVRETWMSQLYNPPKPLTPTPHTHSHTLEILDSMEQKIIISEHMRETREARQYCWSLCGHHRYHLLLFIRPVRFSPSFCLLIFLS